MSYIFKAIGNGAAVAAVLGAVLTVQSGVGWCQAQRANYDGVLIGERATGLGGAFTAVADDASALYYNPAGLVQIPRSGLSLSANTYGYRRTVARGALRSPEESLDLSQDGVQIFPNSVIYVLPFGESGGLDHTLAVGFMVPLAYSYEGQQNQSLPGVGENSDLYVAVDEALYQAGAGYSLRLGNVMLGASLMFLYSSLSDQSHFISTSIGQGTADRYQTFNNTNASYLGVTGDLGALVQLTPNLSLGAKVGLPAARLWSTATITAGESSSLVVEDEDTGEASAREIYQDVYRISEGGESDLRRPWQGSLGLAWRDGDWVISADVRAYMPMDAYDLVGGKLEAPEPQELEVIDESTAEIRGLDLSIVEPEHQLVINGALGASVPVTEEINVMLGAFTDFSAISDETFNELGVDQLDRYGATLAMNQKGENTSLTIGVVGTYGTGRTGGFAYDDNGFAGFTNVKLEEWSVTLMVAGTALFEDEDEKGAE
ncbi:MAG: UPF0164 family protein [Myxococcota bacterium]